MSRTRRYQSTVIANSTVSITKQDTLERFYRKANEDGHVHFYDYELPFDTRWDVRYKQPGENFWRFHETVDILEAVTDDRFPPDGSNYQPSRTGMEAE